jgi:membrane protein
MNEAWKIDRGRGFLKENLISLGMLGAIGAIFVLSVAAAAAARYLVTFFGSVIGPGPGDAVGLAISIGLNLMTSILLFVTLYKWAPNRRVSWQAALFGGVTGGMTWTLFQQLFRFYIAHFGSYNRIYGTLGAIIVLILWAYYSGYILVLGSVVTAVYSERVLGDRGPDSTTQQGGKIRSARGAELARRGAAVVAKLRNEIDR